jgi:hypothetical protein
MVNCAIAAMAMRTNSTMIVIFVNGRTAEG